MDKTYKTGRQADLIAENWLDKVKQRQQRVREELRALKEEEHPPIECLRKLKLESISRVDNQDDGSEVVKQYLNMCHEASSALQQELLQAHNNEKLLQAEIQEVLTLFGYLPRIENVDYHEFMTSLPSGSVDLILTDPPYNISKKTGFKSVVNGEKRFAISMDFGTWDQTEVNLTDMAKVFYNALRRGGTAIIWYDIWKIGRLKEEMEAAGFKMIRQIIWQKTNPVPLNMRSTYLSNSREMAVAAVKVGKPTFNSKYDSGIYEYPIPHHNGNRLHPTQKPLSLFEALVLKHSNQEDLVVDPFLGSGTTGVAAVRNLRRFAGCDLDSKYVRVARERIENDE